MPSVCGRPGPVHMYIELATDVFPVIGVFRWEVHVHGVIFPRSCVEIRTGCINKGNLEPPVLLSLWVGADCPNTPPVTFCCY